MEIIDRITKNKSKLEKLIGESCIGNGNNKECKYYYGHYNLYCDYELDGYCSNYDNKKTYISVIRTK